MINEVEWCELPSSEKCLSSSSSAIDAGAEEGVGLLNGGNKDKRRKAEGDIINRPIDLKEWMKVQTEEAEGVLNCLER